MQHAVGQEERKHTQTHTPHSHRREGDNLLTPMSKRSRHTPPHPTPCNFKGAFQGVAMFLYSDQDVQCTVLIVAVLS